MAVTMRPVTGSSAIVGEGYDPSTKTLYLKFQGSATVTEIPGVEKTTYQDFLNASSKGKFFHERLK